VGLGTDPSLQILTRVALLRKKQGSPLLGEKKAEKAVKCEN